MKTTQWCQMNCSQEEGGTQICRREGVPHTRYIACCYPKEFSMCASCQYGATIMHELLDDEDEGNRGPDEVPMPLVGGE